MYQKKLQLVNPRVKLEQIMNQSNNMHPKAKEIACAIMIYICEQRELYRQHKHHNYYDIQALRRNVINLSKQERIFSNLYPTINNKYEKNKVFKKAIEDLIADGVIYPLNNDEYLLSPLFYYDGYSFLNIYLHWCHITKTKIKNIYVEECCKEGDQYVDLDVNELNSMVTKGICEY